MPVYLLLYEWGASTMLLMRPPFLRHWMTTNTAG
jgi:hypothetical protein